VKIVVDTNIVFSAILNSNGSIAKILLHSQNHFRFYSCNFLHTELVTHRNKLEKITKLFGKEIEELTFLVTENITFINEELLPSKTIIATETLLSTIDLKDTPFVALNKHIKAKLWTGDKELINGLSKKGYKDIITTAQLLKHLEKNRRT
jgi:putative PIN family toxin of toxin-antitoxin system